MVRGSKVKVRGQGSEVKGQCQWSRVKCRSTCKIDLPSDWTTSLAIKQEWREWGISVPTESEEEARGSSSMWTLGKRKGENALNVVVNYDGQVLVHLQHCSKVSGEDRWYPTKRGVALNLAEWDKFVESLVYIDAKVKQLRCKNEQVEPIPPTSIKGNLQSASGEDE